jgi:threonine dehydrogenase-like Zn-dependent dehydrogenase
MKAAVTVAPRHIEVREIPDPVSGPDEALVRIEAIGICASDLHRYLGDHPYTSFPRIQGHELSGVITTLPRDYQGPLQVGELVAIEPLIPCGKCYPCQHGRPNCCTNLQVIGVQTDGGMAELLAVPTKRLYPVGDLQPELAALVEPISIGLWAVIRGQVVAEDNVVVFGAGPIGQAILLASIDRRASVLVVDRLASRLELAKELGAEVVVDASCEDTAAVISEWTNREGPSIVFDATGVSTVIRQAIDLVAASGRVVIVGISRQELSIPVIEFTRKELTILGARNNAGVFSEAVTLVQRYREKVQQLITHRFSLDEVPKALEFALTHQSEVEKIMLIVGGCSS